MSHLSSQQSERRKTCQVQTVATCRYSQSRVQQRWNEMRSDAAQKTGNELEPAADTRPDGDTVKPPKPSAICSSAPTRRIIAGTLLDRHQTVPNSVLDTSQKMSCANGPSVLAGCWPNTASVGDGVSLCTSTLHSPYRASAPITLMLAQGILSQCSVLDRGNHTIKLQRQKNKGFCLIVCTET